MRLLRFLTIAGFLWGIWILLSGKMDVLHLGAGGAAALGVAFLARPRTDERFPLGRFAGYVPWLLWQVLKSNLRVARLALAPRASLAPRVVRAVPSLSDERALTLAGCSITLTPGTVTLDIAPDLMTVHALDPVSAREIETGDVVRRVGGVFRGGGP